MDLNEPKQTQKTLYAQNGPKWAQMSKPIILKMLAYQPSWTYLGWFFYGIILQMTSNLYKSFISDEIKLSLKKISGSKSFLVYTLMK